MPPDIYRRHRSHYFSQHAFKNNDLPLRSLNHLHPLTPAPTLAFVLVFAYWLPSNHRTGMGWKVSVNRTLEPADMAREQAKH